MMDDERENDWGQSDCTMQSHDEQNYLAVCFRCGEQQGILKLHARTFVVRIPTADELLPAASMRHRIVQSELYAYTQEHDRLPDCPTCHIELRLGQEREVEFGPMQMTEIKVLGTTLGRLSRVPNRLRKAWLEPYVYDAHKLLFREALQ